MIVKRIKNLHTGLVEEHTFNAPRYWKIYFKKGATEPMLKKYLIKIDFDFNKDTYGCTHDETKPFEEDESFWHLPPEEQIPVKLKFNYDYPNPYA